MTDYTGAPPPHWPSYQSPGKIWERHPQTPEEWDYRNDPTGQRQNRCEARLAFAGDLADPRAPDQMAIVHRLDVSMLLGELTHRRAQAAMWREKATSPSFQERVAPWMQACFGPTISADTLERNDRFIEEALELVQSLGYGAERAHALVDYVFGRPVGDPPQEVGGVMVTLAALCLASSLDMHAAGEVELERINQPAVIEKIRAKQASKPTGSALPIPVDVEPTSRDAIRAEIINSPETVDFMAGVPLEAAHQRERWGADHDDGKTPFDWFWLVGYLAQKAADAAVRGDTTKALHHTISTGAALANWHAALSGADTRMRPGIAGEKVPA